MTTTFLTLPQAIRLGATMKPQHHDEDYFFKKTGLLGWFGPTCSCAMGAAIDACGLDAHRISGERGWPTSWEPFLLTAAECPACWIVEDGYGIATHLNDHHRWTREAIANWIEAVEQERANTPILEAVTA